MQKVTVDFSEEQIKLLLVVLGNLTTRNSDNKIYELYYQILHEFDKHRNII